MPAQHENWRARANAVQHSLGTGRAALPLQDRRAWHPIVRCRNGQIPGGKVVENPTRCAGTSSARRQWWAYKQAWCSPRTPASCHAAARGGPGPRCGARVRKAAGPPRPFPSFGDLSFGRGALLPTWLASGLELLHDLPFEVCLVGLDVAIPLRHRLLVADPDLLRHLADKAEVVRYQHEAAAELVDGLGQGVNALHVQVVCGLIEQQHMRVHQ
mmetsp:Transcript_98785/g.274934  ORF Transcript_98785/g.274934 Transcript_98785/m.274934 type:complete len:214 (-) Transcript_98785:1544-2185(-)